MLVSPKNALAKQYATMFQLNKTRLHVTPKALQAIAVIAKEKGTGARGLRSIMERLLIDAMFEASTSCCSLLVHLQSNVQQYRCWSLVHYRLMMLAPCCERPGCWQICAFPACRIMSVHVTCHRPASLATTFCSRACLCDNTRPCLYVYCCTQLRLCCVRAPQQLQIFDSFLFCRLLKTM